MDGPGRERQLQIGALEMHTGIIDRLQGIRDEICILVDELGRLRDFDSKTHAERVTEVLSQAQGEALSASEIATRCMIEPGAARVVLYGCRDSFAKIRTEDRVHVKWTLRGSFAEQCVEQREALAV